MQVSVKLAIAASMALSLSSVTVSAEEPRNQAEVESLLRSSFTNINGRESPELIPYHIRMSDFFSRFSHYAPELQKLLSEADFDTLRQFASVHEAVQKQYAEMQLREWKDVAARAEPMSAVEIATELSQSTNRIEATAAARYRDTLNSLSPDGKSAVDKFVFERIRPNTSIEDPLIVAAAAPIFYKAQILGTYKLMQEGKWPPPLPQNAAQAGTTTLGGEAARIGSQ